MDSKNDASAIVLKFRELWHGMVLVFGLFILVLVC